MLLLPMSCSNAQAASEDAATPKSPVEAPSKYETKAEVGSYAYPITGKLNRNIPNRVAKKRCARTYDFFFSADFCFALHMYADVVTGALSQFTPPHYATNP